MNPQADQSTRSGHGRGELARRIVTAVVLAALVVALVLWAPTTVMLLAMAFVVAAAAWEWGALVGLNGGTRAAFVAALTGVGALILAVPALHWPVVIAGGAWWCLAIVRLGGAVPDYARCPSSRRVALIDGVFVLVPAWVAVGVLHPQAGGPGLVLVVMVLCWAADTGAYFGGKRFGRRRLAPRLSPGKTLEGLYAGAATAGLVAVVAGILPVGYDVPSLPMWIGVCMLATLFSVAGDLFESRIKRAAGAKDSGQLLPGHGGVLDRIDSVVAAAPVFALGWIVIGRIGG